MKVKSLTPNKENKNYQFLQHGNKYRNFNQVKFSKADILNQEYLQSDDIYKKYAPQITNNSFNKTPQKYTKRSHINSYNETDDYSAFNQRSNTENFTVCGGTQEKKYSLKDQYIQSKLSNISSYQHKIQSLLEIVNKSPFSGKKQTQILQKYAKNQPKKEVYHIDYPQNQMNYKKAHQVLQKKSQKYPQNNQNRNVFINPNADLHKRKHKRQLSKAQEQYTRKKSKQYMKSIQKQVKQITKTVGLLNQKINKNDQITFKKQINFDDLDDYNQKQEIKVSSHKKREHYLKLYQNMQKPKNHQISCFQFENKNNDRLQDRGNSKSIQFSYEEYKQRKRSQRNQQQKLAKTPTKRSYYEYQREWLNAETPLTPSKKAGQIYKQDHRQKS